MSNSIWRDDCAPIISRILQETAGQTESEIRAALHDAYPYGLRKMHPYKIWCDEIKRQRGKKNPIMGMPNPNQAKLFQ